MCPTLRRDGPNLLHPRSETQKIRKEKKGQNPLSKAQEVELIKQKT